MATNTIAGVNLAAIAEETLPALQSLFAPLAGIVTDFSSDIANAGASVTTRFPTKPTAVDLSSGYTSQNTTLTAKTVTLDKFFGFVYGFNDTERSKSSLRLNDVFIAPALQGLGDKVFGDLWNLVVSTNFATSTTITAANFDRDDLVDIGTTLTATKKAPKQGRTVWSAPAHYGSLVKTLNSAEFPGADANKAEANVPRTAGFNIYETDQADANAENLAAFAFHKSSLLMAARGVDFEMAGQAGVEVETVIIPGLNLPVQFRRWYDPNAGELKYSVGLLYGVAVGQDFGVRVVTA
jgi:hypothetical protein